MFSPQKPPHHRRFPHPYSSPRQHRQGSRHGERFRPRPVAGSARADPVTDDSPPKRSLYDDHPHLFSPPTQPGSPLGWAQHNPLAGNYAAPHVPFIPHIFNRYSPPLRGFSGTGPQRTMRQAQHPIPLGTRAPANDALNYPPISPIRPRAPVGQSPPGQEDPVKIDFTLLKKHVEDAVSNTEMTQEDLFFLKQLELLNIDRVFRTSLMEDREAMKRAASEQPGRAQNQAEVKAKEKKRVEAEALAKRIAEEKRKEFERRQAQERRRQIEAERKRAEEARKAELYRQKVLEELRKQQEQREQEQAERARREQAERARLAVEREEKQRRMREAAQREAQQAQAQRILQLDEQFGLYDAKWAELKTSTTLPPIVFAQLPWPVLDTTPTCPADITYEKLQQFVFCPLRKGMEAKSHRDRVKMDMLKWHPDKFNAKVLDKIVEWEREAVSEAAGVVARLLTQMMGEVEKE